MKESVTQGRLKELFNYDKDTGIFTWIKKGKGRKVGKVAGGLCSRGYNYIRVDGVRQLAHRLAWLYIHGYLPGELIDHKDRNKSNNSISNLREVNSVCNLRNTGNQKNNTSGVKGITWDSHCNSWKSAIKITGCHIHLGLSKDLLEAVCTRLAAEQAEDWAGCDSSSPAFQYVQEYLRGKTYDYLSR